MMQLVAKWKVTAKFSTTREQHLWLYGNHIGNVLQQLSGIGFSKDGFDDPVGISVELVPTQSQVTVTTDYKE